MPQLETVEVHNYRVKNAIRWLWLIEGPMKAHLNYMNDKRAIRQMLNPAKDVESDRDESPEKTSPAGR